MGRENEDSSRGLALANLETMKSSCKIDRSHPHWTKSRANSLHSQMIILFSPHTPALKALLVLPWLQGWALIKGPGWGSLTGIGNKTSRVSRLTISHD